MLQVKTMSSHQCAAGTATWKTCSSGMGRSFRISISIGAPQSGHVLETWPSTCRAAGMPKASHAQFPYHQRRRLRPGAASARPRTDSPSGSRLGPARARARWLRGGAGARARRRCRGRPSARRASAPGRARRSAGRRGCGSSGRGRPSACGLARASASLCQARGHGGRGQNACIWKACGRATGRVRSSIWCQAQGHVSRS